MTLKEFTGVFLLEISPHLLRNCRAPRVEVSQMNEIRTKLHLDKVRLKSTYLLGFANPF